MRCALFGKSAESFESKRFGGTLFTDKCDLDAKIRRGAGRIVRGIWDESGCSQVIPEDSMKSTTVSMIIHGVFE
jgi:hypothetical protein